MTSGVKLAEEIETKTKTKVLMENGSLWFWLWLDMIFNFTLVSFMKTASWRGVINLIHMSFTGNFGMFKASLSNEGILFIFTTGILLNIVVKISCVHIHYSVKNLQGVEYFLTTRLFTLIYFFSRMWMWAGFWDILNQYLAVEVVPNYLFRLVPFVASTAFLCVMGCFQTVVGVPAQTASDFTREYCLDTTALQPESLPDTRTWFVIVFDAVLTVSLELAVVMTWFCTNEVLRNHLTFTPCLLCWIIGTGIGALAFLAQLVLLPLIEKDEMETSSKRFLRRLVQFVLSSLGLLSTVFHWYGMWVLLDRNFLVENPMLSNIISGTAGFLGLTALQVSRSLHGGLYKDGLKGVGYPFAPYCLIPIISAQRTLQ